MADPEQSSGYVESRTRSSECSDGPLAQGYLTVAQQICSGEDNIVGTDFVEGDVSATEVAQLASQCWADESQWPEVGDY